MCRAQQAPERSVQAKRCVVPSPLSFGAACLLGAALYKGGDETGSRGWHLDCGGGAAGPPAAVPAVLVL